MLNIKRLLLAVAAITLIAGCSDSDSGPGKATITAENAVDLAVAGTEAAKMTADSDDIPLFKSGASSGGFDAYNFSKQIAQNAMATTDESAGVCDSGTFILNESDSTTNYSGTATFTDCTFTEGGETVVLNGVLSITGNNSRITISANLSVRTVGGGTETLVFTSTCSYDGSNVGTCTYSSTFTGIDGRTYAAANISVTGNYFNGYTISGSVTDPEHGVITISTNAPITFECLNGNPDNGELVITGANGTATVTYTSCDSFTVTFEGVGNNYSWADI